MYMTHRHGVTWLMLIAGALLLIGGLGGLCSLYTASQEYEPTTATVRSIQTKRVYRGKKLRYDSQMLISYPTAQYGEVSTATASYCPFRRKGDKVTVWYHPDRPREIRLPIGECVIWGLVILAGAICIGGGMLFRKKPET